MTLGYKEIDSRGRAARLRLAAQSTRARETLRHPLPRAPRPGLFGCLCRGTTPREPVNRPSGGPVGRRFVTAPPGCTAPELARKG